MSERRTSRASRRTFAAGLAVLLAVAVSLSACSKKSPKPAAIERATFVAGIVKPASLDPALARTTSETIVADQLFDSLTAYDPRTLAPVPALAASWSATDDQQHWDFTLRPGATFSDGAPVTATDVKATLDRIARKDTASTVADLLEPVTGYRAVAVDGSATELAGVVVASPTVVHIDLDTPLSALPAVLANPAFGVVPASAAAVGSAFPAFPGAPPTSGPFRLTAGSDRSLALAAKAPAKRLTFDLFADRGAAYDAMARGSVDWAEVPSDRVAEATKSFGRGQFRPYVAELFYAFNLRSPKFADHRVREAIVRAIDRPALVRAVYGDTVRPADRVLVDGIPGATAGGAASPCGDPCTFDRERAKALLADVTSSGGTVPEVALDFEDDKTQQAVATAIQKDLEAIGVTATLRSKPLSEYQQFAVSGQQELFRLGWVAPYASADALLHPLFTTSSPNNLAGYSSAGVDADLAAARSTADASAQAAHWQAAERAILADVPIIPLAQFEVQTVVSRRVRGLEMTSFGSFDGRAVTVAATKR